MTTDDIPPLDKDDAEDIAQANARLGAFLATPSWTTPAGEHIALQPATEYRFELAAQLNDLDGGIDWELVQENVMAFYPYCSKIMWLMTHDEDDIMAARSNRRKWLIAVDEWSAQWMPRDNGDRVSEAIGIATQLLNERRINRAVPRPSGGREGN